MLDRVCVEEIHRLVVEGKLSQRKIAHRLGVSRATVSAIASGARALVGRQPALATGRESKSPQRCPKCGFLVEMPCVVCRTRAYQHGRRVLAAMAALRAPAVRRPPLRRSRQANRARIA